MIAQPQSHRNYEKLRRAVFEECNCEENREAGETACCESSAQARAFQEQSRASIAENPGRADGDLIFLSQACETAFRHRGRLHERAIRRDFHSVSPLKPCNRGWRRKDRLCS